jgi:trimethylamine---corrinoid protein Co-methyltransferase
MENVNKLQFLSDRALADIESTAHRLLDEVGIALEHAEAREMLHGLGCRMEGRRTLIPPDVVAWAVENVTPHQDFYNIDGSHAFSFDGQRLRFHNGGGPPFIYDLENGKRRPATLKDVADMTRLLDALPHVDVVVPLFGPQDVPPQLLNLASTEVMLRNTRKPVSSAAIEKPEYVDYTVQMAAACCGGMEAYREHPSMIISVSPVSPLTFSADITASIMAVVKSGSPFYPLPAPSLGATSSITMAGALAQQHAEVLSSLVIAAAAHPGALVGYSSRINPIDLRTAVSSWGGPEVGMTGACAAQLAHRLGLPCDSYGLSTSSTRLDAQFAYERLANAVTPALAGADILSGVGTTDSGMAGALEIAVIDNEIIGLLKRVAQGCAVNDDTLAFDVMRDVILGDGVFLGEEHTVRHMRKGALWTPEISVRSTSDDSEQEGVVARAKSRAAQILENHQVEPLLDEVSRQLDQIMERARRELVGG